MIIIRKKKNMRWVKERKIFESIEGRNNRSKEQKFDKEMRKIDFKMKIRT